MKREIKFRGFSITDKKWVYGYYQKTVTSGYDIIVNDANYSRVDPETVGQFTGLKDKNGKEIYELMEINNKYRIVYNFNEYVLQSISNRDIFVKINKDDELEITGEYNPLP
jgi:hypothetical protein